MNIAPPFLRLGGDIGKRQCGEGHFKQVLGISGQEICPNSESSKHRTIDAAINGA
ncbi:hypothetical protein GCM10010136_06850 [Limoniibacter endophyticus]|uniref:Uncharacterized protein n=1 Tax=Limoniibacter endophyticus TaxID=1565040 RepID=A0A8J3DLL7_9HYPH|nr:hypothetical protein GCM10010136_06850 [Limoniibacter endophyticus]